MSLAADNNPADEKAVREVIERLNRAARAGDGATLQELFSEDLVYVHSNATNENKAQAVAGLVKDKIDFQMQPNWKVQIHGNTAIATGRMIAKSPQPEPVPLDTVMVWVKSGTAWKLVARHTTRYIP